MALTFDFMVAFAWDKRVRHRRDVSTARNGIEIVLGSSGEGIAGDGSEAQDYATRGEIPAQWFADQMGLTDVWQSRLSLAFFIRGNLEWPKEAVGGLVNVGYIWPRTTERRNDVGMPSCECTLIMSKWGMSDR